MCLRCISSMCKLAWDFDYNSSCTQRVGVVKKSCYFPRKYHMGCVMFFRQWTGSSLVQVMACHLFGAKPLPETMLIYRQLDSWEHMSEKLESDFKKIHLKMSSAKMATILSRARCVKAACGLTVPAYCPLLIKKPISLTRFFFSFIPNSRILAILFVANRSPTLHRFAHTTTAQLWKILQRYVSSTLSRRN